MHAQTPTVYLPKFHDEATKLSPDGKLGQVLSRQSIPTTLAGADAWLIAYVSSDALERKTVVTALVVAPKGDIPEEGRPIVSWAHGTTGTSENCGPSQLINPAQPLNQYLFVGGNSWTDYGVPAIETFIKEGYAVVATDYQGLGGGGVHQYAVATTQGRDAINAIRAVGAMGLAGANKKAVVYGWSQGGGATIAAASLSDTISQSGTAYDGIDIVGFVALAPQDVAALAPKIPSDPLAAGKTFAILVGAFSDNVFNFTHLAMTLWANTAAFPDLKLTDVFTDAGAKAVDAIMRGKCVHGAADTINFTFGDAYKSMFEGKTVEYAGLGQGAHRRQRSARETRRTSDHLLGDQGYGRPPGHGQALPRSDVRSGRQRHAREARRRADALLDARRLRGALPAVDQGPVRRRPAPDGCKAAE